VDVHTITGVIAATITQGILLIGNRCVAHHFAMATGCGALRSLGTVESDGCPD
jgi:hypothetical protein